jgi:hypothetical protein
LKVHSGVDMVCQPGWPQLDGAYVLVNEIQTNSSGRPKQVDSKKRNKPQVVVFCRDKHAQARLKRALQVDESKYELKFCFDANELDVAIGIAKSAIPSNYVSMEQVEGMVSEQAKLAVKKLINDMTPDQLKDLISSKSSKSSKSTKSSVVASSKSSNRSDLSSDDDTSRNAAMVVSERKRKKDKKAKGGVKKVKTEDMGGLIKNKADKPNQHKRF